MLSACGMKCTECDFFGKYCEGCDYIKGQPFWAMDTPDGRCGIYHCCTYKRKYDHCGSCAELPCELFKILKDPKVSEEEHLRMLKLRVERLRENR